MTTDKQTHHKKYLCPQCGELLHFRNEKHRELHCPVCGLTDTYRFDLGKILFLIQSQRRREKGSVGKRILNEYQRAPVLIRKDYWLVYILGYYARIFYDTQTNQYEYFDKEGKIIRFNTVSELIEMINSNISKYSTNCIE